MSTLINDDTISQCQAIAQDLKAGRKITPIDALHSYECLRLGARIFDLKERGMNIDRDMVTKGGKRVAEYYVVNTKQL